MLPVMPLIGINVFSVPPVNPLASLGIGQKNSAFTILSGTILKLLPLQTWLVISGKFNTGFTISYTVCWLVQPFAVSVYT